VDAGYISTTFHTVSFCMTSPDLEEFRSRLYYNDRRRFFQIRSP
jgi:hypothetical protein